MKNKLLVGLLAVLFLADLILITRDDAHFLRFLTKPLLVPVIIAIYLSETHVKTDLNRLFLGGLIFSFLGDTFLLFNWGFLPGLGSFFLAHVLYILSFVKFRLTNIYGSLPFLLLYLAFLLYFLHPYLHEMEIPVVIYGTALSTMAYFSLRTKNAWFISGAFLFVVSDSLLSFNLFVEYTATMGQVVMATYVAAQYCLIRGMISQKHLSAPR